MAGAMWNVWGERRFAYRAFGGGGLKERDYSQDLGLDGRIILRKMLSVSVGKAWIRLIWLSRGGFF
jgi:hypothetical protein